MITLQQGGVANRPGTRFVRAAKYGDRDVRLLPFIFSETQTYILEFGDYYVRFHKSGGTVLDAPPAWVGATGYALGQIVKNDTSPVKVYRCIVAGTSAGSGGPTGTGSSILDGTTLRWKYIRDYSASTPLEVETPWPVAYIRDLNYVQSADVLTVVHPLVPPQELRRYSETDWRISVWAITRTIAPPTGLVAYPNYELDDPAHPKKVWSYVCTLQRFSPPEESLPSVSLTLFSAIYLDRPTLLNLYVTSLTIPFIDQINFYRGLSSTGPFGFVGSVKVTPGGYPYNFVDDVSIPSYIDQPPTGRDPFTGAGNYPSVVAYHEQRLVFGASVNNPQTLWLSRSGNYKSFDFAEPSQDDDSITMTVASNRVDGIREIFSGRTMLTLTGGSEIVVGSGGDGPMTPSALDAKPQSFRGSAKLRPLAIGNVVLYLQQKGNRIRELIYDFQQDIYGGADLCLLSDHLFRGKQLVDWAYAGVPFSAVWACRNDGMLLGMTYLREHEVIGWHRHDTQQIDNYGRSYDGAFLSVAVVPEGNEDVPYFAVSRPVDGVLAVYIERQASREYLNPADGMFLDCGLTHDGWNTSSATAVSLDVFTSGSIATVTCLGTSFGSEALGEGFFLRDSNYRVYRSVITEKTSSTKLKVRLAEDLPLELQGSVTAWSFAHFQFSGLDHLALRTVSIVADGHVYPDQIVSAGGAITLDYAAATVHVGFPYVAEIETLGLAMDQVDVFNRQKMVVNVGIEVDNTKGVWVGEAGGELTEAKQRETENLNEPVRPMTDQILVSITSSWNAHARVVVKQLEPMPLTVVGLHPEIEIGG